MRLKTLELNGFKSFAQKDFDGGGTPNPGHIVKNAINKKCIKKLLFRVFPVIIHIMNTITVSKNKIDKEGGVVVLSLREYQKMQTSSTPTYYLQGKKARNLDKLIKSGLKSYKTGKTKVLESLADLD